MFSATNFLSIPFCLRYLYPKEMRLNHRSTKLHTMSFDISQFSKANIFLYLYKSVPFKLVNFIDWTWIYYILFFRSIYMNQELSLVVKWALLLIEVEITLKWDFMFSLVAITIFSVWWRRWGMFNCTMICHN